MTPGKQYVRLNEAGYVTVLSTTPVGGGLPEPVELPDDFQFAVMHCYRFEDGQLVFDPAM